MSIRAVGWLGSKLGVDIGGRTAQDEAGTSTESGELAGFATAQNCSSHADPVASRDDAGSSGEGVLGVSGSKFVEMAGGWESKLGQVWKQASEKATQYWKANTASGEHRNDLFGFGSARSEGGSGGADDRPELDENGLPVTQNWYYYDAQMGRWAVSPDAPESVRQEYYAQLEEMERERLGQKKVVPPPPPPPPRPNNALPGAPCPRTGDGKGGPASFFGAGGARGSGGYGPHYAVPDYFGGPSVAPSAQQPQLTQSVAPYNSGSAWAQPAASYTTQPLGTLHPQAARDYPTGLAASDAPPSNFAPVSHSQQPRSTYPPNAFAGASSQRPEEALPNPYPPSFPLPPHTTAASEETRHQMVAQAPSAPLTKASAPPTFHEHRPPGAYGFTKSDTFCGGAVSSAGSAAPIPPSTSFPPYVSAPTSQEPRPPFPTQHYQQRQEHLQVAAPGSASAPAQRPFVYPPVPQLQASTSQSMMLPAQPPTIPESDGHAPLSSNAPPYMPGASDTGLVPPSTASGLPPPPSFKPFAPP